MAYRKTYARKRFVKKRFTGKRKRYSRPSMYRKQLVRTIKKVVLKKVEPKCKRTAIGNTNVLHNTYGYRIQLNQTANMPIQGVGDTQRVGDQINLTGFKIKMMIEQKADRPNVTWKLYVVSVPKGSGYGYSSWFENTTGNLLLDEPNKDFVKVLKSAVWRPNQASLTADASSRDYSFTKTIWVSRKKILKFGPSDGAITHNDSDIHLLLTGYDAYGTLETDQVGNCQALVEVYYRDP